MSLGVGIIGLSAERGWAAVAHVPALRSVPGIELRAASASSPANAKLAAHRHGVPIACDDAESLATHPDVDLVVVTVKVPRHSELVGHALRAGKKVLCEWPLGNGTAEAEAMTTYAAARELNAWVGLQALASPAIRYTADLVAQGAIGEVLSTTLVSAGEEWGPTVRAGNEYILDATNGASMLTVPFGHTSAAMALVLGEFADLTAVVATRRPTVRTADGADLPMTAPDQIAISGTLTGGAVASIHVRGGKPSGLRFHWEITGTEGELVLTGRHGHLQFGLVDLHRAAAGEALTPVEIPAHYTRVPGDPTSMSFSVAQAYAGLLADLDDGGHRTPTFADAVRRHRLLDTIERAAATGTRQAFDEEPSCPSR